MSFQSLSSVVQDAPQPQRLRPDPVGRAAASPGPTAPGSRRYHDLDSLRALLVAIIRDDEIGPLLKLAPAAKVNHHAYLGGLLEHIDLDLDRGQPLGEADPILHRLRDFLVVQGVARRVDQAAAIGDRDAAPAIHELDEPRRPALARRRGALGADGAGMSDELVGRRPLLRAPAFAHRLLAPLGDGLPLALSALSDVDRIARARLHPLAILLALRTYAQGQGDRGGLQWEPVQSVIDALNAAFYTAFRAVEPTGKRLLLALDVSGSMAMGRVAGSSLTPREASAALALMTAATEPQTHIVGFTGGMVPLPLSPSMRLDDGVRAVSDLPLERTDCAQPVGACKLRPVLCDPTMAFSCGCDRVTYWNDCIRQRSGVTASTPDYCKTNVAKCDDPSASTCP